MPQHFLGLANTIPVTPPIVNKKINPKANNKSFSGSWYFIRIHNGRFYINNINTNDINRINGSRKYILTH